MSIFRFDAIINFKYTFFTITYYKGNFLSVYKL